MAKDETEGEEGLPDKVAAKEFYAKYEPKEILGRGVSSVVRRCIEKETGVEFAAKIIDLSNDPEDPDGAGMRETTKREIEILRVVAGHPYIIELHDVFESSTFIFLVFELCRNGELFDYLTSVVTMSEKKTKHFMQQVFEALEHVHSKNIVHRDLKPENILLDNNFNIKLTDFGFARILEPEEKLFETCGTPGYLAPELLRAAMFEGEEGYSQEVDVLVGCPPFWHRKQMVMLRNIMEGSYSFSSPEWADITDLPKDLIRKLLVVDPKQRIKLSDAIKHPFLHGVDSSDPFEETRRVREFDAKRTFKYAMTCVRAMVRIKRIRYTPAPLSMEMARIDPYRLKQLRKAIDGCAFRVYGHWVKKEEGQNRAALFENTPKIEAKQKYLREQQENGIESESK